MPRVGQEPAFRRLPFHQALVSGCFIQVAEEPKVHRSKTDNQAKYTDHSEGRGAEGISLSPCSQTSSAQLWSGGKEKVVPIPLGGVSLSSSGAGRFPRVQHSEAVTLSQARTPCSSKPRKRAGRSRRNEEV